MRLPVKTVKERNTLLKELTSAPSYPHQERVGGQVKEKANKIFGFLKNASLGVKLRSIWCYEKVSDYTNFSTTWKLLGFLYLIAKLW